VTAVHLIAPEGIGDPRRPSGGNTFDRRICRGLADAGWTVHLHEVAGTAALRDAVARIPAGAVVLVDGLVASPAPDVLVTEAARVRLVVLLHVLSGDDEREGAVLAAAAAVVTTSAWTRRAVLERYALPEHRVHVAEPGVDAAELAPGTATAGALLSVGAVTRVKGHDVLVDALAALGDRRWHCLCVGSLDRDRAFAARLHRRVAGTGLHGRVRFAGPQVGAALARSYGGADVLVLPSRAETYGMVVTEALARGLPVIAADVGGVPEALGHGASGARPGLLVPPDDPAALRDALRAWLEDAGLRRRLRRAARERRAALPRWSTTTSVLAGVLAEAAA
jgi:glycosyltransferase involved in cell wall biosynthesis